MQCPSCKAALKLEADYNLEFRLYCTNRATVQDRRYTSGQRRVCGWISHEIRLSSKIALSMKNWLAILSYEDFFDKDGRAL